jgi:hypothetical protein
VTGRATGRLVGEAPHKTHRLVDAAVILSRTTRALGIMQPWCMQAAGSGRQVVVGIRALRAQQAAVLLLRRLAMLLVRLYSRPYSRRPSIHTAVRLYILRARVP